MVKRLRANLALNGLTENVEVEDVALGVQDGHATLNLVERNLGQSSLRAVKSVKSISVAVRPLVHYMPEEKLQYEIFVIKIDVEGFEDEILIPFLSTISKDRMPDAILVETLHDDSWSADLRGVLMKGGYVPYFDGEEGNTLFMKTEHGSELEIL